ncbi:MAG: DoxX family protein [Gammaproteobacteria bacterium]|nr:DoxX family protein [Gammaproteobacteria bacterium]
MSIAAALDHANAFAARVAAWLASPLLLAIRCYVSWQFLKSGWLKVSNWSNTLDLFRDEYHVPLLPPDIAAVAGAAGEIVFPSLLIAGLATRYAAVGLSAVNVIAVVSYADVLLSEGFEAALGQHYLWGSLLLVVAVFGAGRWSLDETWLRPDAGRSPPSSGLPR